MKTDSPNAARYDISARANHPPHLTGGEAAGRDSNGQEKITAEQIQAAVRQYWDIWMAKSAAALVDAYATNGTTFRVGSVSIEPGFMGIAQRSREYFHEACIMHMDLGPIEVILLNDTTAVAIYTFQFHALNRAVASAREGLKEESIPNGRATQVLRRSHDGKMRILHEHISSAV
jgi:ketosteroid isomerase-like protein